VGDQSVSKNTLALEKGVVGWLLCDYYLLRQEFFPLMFLSIRFNRNHQAKHQIRGAAVKTLRQLFATILLVLALGVSIYAGEMSGRRVVQRQAIWMARAA
jgi:hypothetical protein